MELIMRINADDTSLHLLFIQIKTPFKCVCPRYRVQSTKYRVQGTGYKVQGTKYRVQSTESGL